MNKSDESNKCGPPNPNPNPNPYLTPNPDPNPCLCLISPFPHLFSLYDYVSIPTNNGFPSFVWFICSVPFIGTNRLEGLTWAFCAMHPFSPLEAPPFCFFKTVVWLSLPPHSPYLLTLTTEVTLPSRVLFHSRWFFCLAVAATVVSDEVNIPHPPIPSHPIPSSFLLLLSS